MADQLGRTLGQYQIIDEIGRGGMAIVYRAFQPALERYVAIKVLPPQLAFDASFVQRFLLEARAAARLDHPHIVTIHDVGEHDGVYYIVMQELHGEPLSRLIQSAGRLPLGRVASIIQQIASALDYAHSQGFVHRDVKPANIIVGPDDKATLTDFGIAKAVEGARLTQTGAAIGTPEYMAPEQAQGQPVGPATDIYSLGLVAYEMLVGQAPFTASSTPAVLYKQVHERPRPARAAAPNLPESVDLALARALAKEPNQRFRTAGEFARALQQTAVGLPALATPPAALAGPATLAEPVTVAAPGVAPARRPAWPLAALMAAIVVVAAGLLWLALQARSTPAATPALPTGQPVAELPLNPSTPRPETPTTTPAPPASTPTAAPVVSSTSALPANGGRPQLISGQAINLYTGPGRQYQRLGQTTPDQRLEVVGRDSNSAWLVVCCLGGEPGWMEAGLVALPDSLAQLPVATASDPTATPSPISTTTPTSLPAQPPPPTATPSPTEAPSPTPIPPPPPPRVDRAFAGAFGDAYGREIYGLYEGEQSTRRLTEAVGNDGYPAISPNRTLIAFEAGRHGDEFGSDIWLMNSDGSNQRRLTAERGDDAQPAFSPDGRLIAFISNRTGVFQIYLMALDGSSVRRVPSPGWAFAPSFSPDGARLVFVATEDSQVYQVFTMALDGSDLRQITYSAAHNENPSFTADGRAIIFDSRSSGGPRDIIRVDLDSGAWTNLTNSPTDDFQPAQSWDGSRILFTRVAGALPHLWTMNLDGSDQRQWTDLGLIGEIDPAWSR